MDFEDVKKIIFKLAWMAIIFNQLYLMYHMIYIYSIFEESNLIPIENIGGVFYALQVQTYVVLFLIACLLIISMGDILKIAEYLATKMKKRN